MRGKWPMSTVLTVAFVIFGLQAAAAAENPSQVDSLSAQCAMDICGDPKAFLNISEMIDARKVIDPAVANDFNQRIKPQLEVWVSENLNNLRRQIRASSNGVSELTKSPLSPNEIAINNLVWALGHRQFNTLLSSATSDSYNRTVIDRARASSALLSMDASEREYLIDYVEAIINVPEYRELNFLATASYSDLMAVKYPYQDLKTAAQADGQHFVALQNKLVALDPNLNFLSWITRQNFINLAKGNEVILNPDTKWRIAKARLNLALYHEVLTPGSMRDLFVKRSVNYNSDQLETKIQKVIAQLKSVISNQSKMNGQKNKLMDGCLQAYNFSILAAPSENELKNIRASVDAIKTAAEKVAVEWAGAESAANAIGAIQKVNFLFPIKSSEVSSIWLQAIQAMRASDQQDAAAKTLPQWVSRYSFDALDDITDDAIFYSIPNLCSSLQPSGLSDHALTTLGKISLSWPTVKFPSFGEGIIAHEIGHVISSAFGRTNSNQFQQFQKMRQCTVMRHMYPSDLSFADNMNYLEEDGADTFAAQVIKRLYADLIPPNKNFACLFLDKNGNSYASDKQPLTLKNPNQFDRHSSDFFRALQIQLEFGKLPQSCRLVTAVQGFSRFNLCGK